MSGESTLAQAAQVSLVGRGYQGLALWGHEGASWDGTADRSRSLSWRSVVSPLRMEENVR